jgi:hypothetical protein
MAENLPNIGGSSEQQKPAEASKIQPKKETVRINLPPKPTATPTVKLPTPPVGGATNLNIAGQQKTPQPPQPAAPAAVASPTATPPPAAHQQPAAKAPAKPQMPVSMPAAPSVSMIDTILAILAAVIGIAAAVRVFLLS